MVIKEAAADVMFWLREQAMPVIWGESILGREGSRYKGAEAGVCLVSGGPLSREVSKWNRG